MASKKPKRQVGDARPRSKDKPEPRERPGRPKIVGRANKTNSKRPNPSRLKRKPINKDIPKNPETVKLSVTQTSKGYFYIRKLSAEGKTVDDMFKQFDKLANGAIKRLKKLNNEKDRNNKGQD